MEMEGWLSWFQENAALLLVHNRAHLAGQLLSFVRVENPPDLTGETRQYFLSVPPWMKTAAEAVAWTYDIPETNYAELVRT